MDGSSSNQDTIRRLSEGIQPGVGFWIAAAPDKGAGLVGAVPLTVVERVVRKAFSVT